MKAPLRLAIAGLGTVGAGVVSILQRHSELIAQRCGRALEIVAVSARSKGKDRGLELGSYAWEDDPVALAQRGDIDVFIELMGGDCDPAKASIEAALESGKHVVTANKALMAIHGQALAQRAEEAQLSIGFEAAVAGGIPVIKALSEGFAGNQVMRVVGVINGTCNYILTRMEKANLSYEEAFSEADALGYLEADSKLDVGGIDAAHKLALLSALAFGAQVDFAAVAVQGISDLSYDDIACAADFGFRIKLLGVAQCKENRIEQRMSPCLVPANSSLGQLENSTNMVIFDGDSIGQIALRGIGAGSGPTASAVVGDIIDIARGYRRFVFGVPAHTLTKYACAEGVSKTPYYLRMLLKDRSGALAQVTSVLGGHKISIDRMRQPKHKSDMACVVIITHAVHSSSIVAAQAEITGLDMIEGKVTALRIEDV